MCLHHTSYRLNILLINLFIKTFITSYYVPPRGINTALTLLVCKLVPVHRRRGETKERQAFPDW